MMHNFFRDYLFRLVVGLSVTCTISALAVVNRIWSWPNAVVGGLLLLCATLYLMEKLGIGPSLKTRVRNWLDSSSYSIQTIQDTNEFHFIMTDNVGLRTDILRANTDAPVMIAVAGLKATPEQLATYESLTKPQQQAFWRGVRLDLLRYGIQFSDLTLDGSGVAVSDMLMISRDFSGTEFLRRVLFVRSGARLYYELLLSLTPSSAR